MSNNPEISTESNYVLIQQKSFGWDYTPPPPPSVPVCTRKQKAHMRTLKIPSACQTLVDYKNTQITLHVLTVLKFSKC